jgi:hypothetical protein
MMHRHVMHLLVEVKTVDVICAAGNSSNDGPGGGCGITPDGQHCAATLCEIDSDADRYSGCLRSPLPCIEGVQLGVVLQLLCRDSAV